MKWLVFCQFHVCLTEQRAEKKLRQWKNTVDASVVGATATAAAKKAGALERVKQSIRCGKATSTDCEERLQNRVRKEIAFHLEKG